MSEFNLLKPYNDLPLPPPKAAIEIGHIEKYENIKYKIINSGEFHNDQITALFCLINDYSSATTLGYFWLGNFKSSLEEIVCRIINMDKQSVASWIVSLINEISSRFFKKDYNRSMDSNDIPQKSLEILFKTIICSETFIDLKNNFRIKDYHPPFFIYIFLLISTIKKINDVSLLEASVKNIDEAAAVKKCPEEDKEIFKSWFIIRLLINSENIAWETKNYLFWHWKDNPYFNFFDIDNFDTFETIYRFQMIDDIKSLKIYNFIDLLNAIRAELSHDQNEKAVFMKNIFKKVKSQSDQCFKNIFEIINNPDAEGYIATDNFLAYSHSDKFIFNNAFIANIYYVNAIVRNLIPLTAKITEKQKAEEFFHLCFFLEAFGDKYEITKIKKTESPTKKTESPDFILKSKNGDIGLELVSIEPEDEFIPQSRLSSLNEAKWIDPEMTDFKEQLKNRIDKKLKKCDEYKKKTNHGRLWLYIHSAVLGETGTIYPLFRHDIPKNNLNDFSNEIKQKQLNQDNHFDKIFINDKEFSI